MQFRIPKGWHESVADSSSSELMNPLYPNWCLRWEYDPEGYFWTPSRLEDGRHVSGIYNSYTHVSDAIAEIKENS